MVKFQSERKFAKVFDFHSYARDVRPNYGECGTLPSTISQYFRSIGQVIANSISYALGVSCCMGGDIHVAFQGQGSLAYLLETGTAFQPTAPVMRQELVRVWPGTLYFLGLPIAVQGHVYNAATRAPIEAAFTIRGVTFAYGERWTSHPVTGRYHLWLPTGSWTVDISASRFVTRTVVLSINQFGIKEDIFLNPQ